jgi:hypothetical protein
MNCENCRIITLQKLEELRDLIWRLDIPHPTVPEYVELHEKMQRIAHEVDKIINGLK